MLDLYLFKMSVNGYEVSVKNCNFYIGGNMLI